ncbi:hypothetical protein J7E50_21470 [Pedobacter sp. ISL-68]|uniref:hypothetical protein n=1 Tax=unclassified Pedobacter TaxID=2628915 RepID=UPI001BE810DC|nr:MULTISPECIES: hypothetical protein [unclassified Pedobacter]MBT2563791.1 hypothetical protein [Pedobacter sp. ISL-64]MBT2592803.1 hypothetical protein [Pedobacter sp. ISL-68]
MQDNNAHIEVLEQLAAGVDPATGEIFPPDSPYQQPPVIRALYFAINEIKSLAQKGKQGQPWTTEEDSLLLKDFNEGTKISQLAKLHGRSYGAIKARLIKLEMLEK